jgi:hypothetical protein
MSNRECAWCKCSMGHKAGLKAGEITHGICDECMVAMFPVPHIDEGLLLECKQSGIAPHDLAQITPGYVTAFDTYEAVEGMEKVAYASIWIKAHNKLTAIRKASRRAKLLRNPRTRKYVV